MGDVYSTITQRGTKAQFMEALSAAPNVYEPHCMIIPSDAPDEQYVWVGAMREPQEFLSERSLDALREYSLTITNKEYELSMLINQTSMEDDKHGMINKRISDMALAWSTFRDALFALLLINGETATDTFDGTTFHDDTRTIGDSAQIDNSLTAAIAAINSPTVAELGTAIQLIQSAMWRYQDDKGRTAFNAGAMSRLMCAIPPEHFRVFTELVNSSLISNSDNPWGQGIVEFAALPYLTDADNAFYTSAIADTRKGFVYQERTTLQVEVLNSSEAVADNHGVKVLARQRFRFGYGEPRRNVRYDFTQS